MLTSKIAEFINSAGETPSFAEGREAAFRCILDLLGAAAAGVNSPGALAVRSAAVSVMQSGNIPIWFTDKTSSVIGAAWANSAAASALDLDDGHRLARGHPGAAVIPAVFATAQQLGSSLDEIISAIVVGYEVGVTIAAARLTYGNTGTWAPYAVVAAAAVLRRTSVGVLAHALAIAGESAPNQLFASAPAQTPPPEGSDVKEGIPWAVVTGLMALDLAEAGHTGPRNILDSQAHYRLPETENFGAAMHITRTYFKSYACCRHIHAPLDALLEIIQAGELDVSAIKEIIVRTYGGALRISNKARPDNLTDVQYSIPFCLALVALRGPQELLPLTDRNLFDPSVAALAERVTLTFDGDLDKHFPAQTLAQVTVDLGDRQISSEVVAPRGEATDPLTWSELGKKFYQEARFELDRAEVAKIVEMITQVKVGRSSTPIYEVCTAYGSDRASQPRRTANAAPNSITSQNKVP